MFMTMCLLLCVWWSLFLPLCGSPQRSVCQLLLISAREVASVLSSDKSPDPGVKECEPGTVTIKTFPLGRTMLNTSANALMISEAFVFFVADLLPRTSVVHI
ncbi:hypothetical protein PBY51_023304 [Eleginops maclovinus]|uniref:Secreted protein n=1 Tax=Eleginops maclovinus TaxID=56733 RepID=A0AAN7WYI1_ELEMC|nr:hypothetical protein PBY51_023304 [Eleginops maclovinus]